MSEPTRDRLVLEVNRTKAEGGVQVVLSQLDAKGSGWGYRLAGPKHYNMGVTTLLEEDLDERDANSLRGMLDDVYPAPAQVIETPEQAKALPAGTVLIELDEDTDTTEFPNVWYRAATGDRVFWEAPGETGEWDETNLSFPLRVLHQPNQAGQR